MMQKLMGVLSDAELDVSGTQSTELNGKVLDDVVPDGHAGVILSDAQPGGVLSDSLRGWSAGIQLSPATANRNRCTGDHSLTRCANMCQVFTYVTDLSSQRYEGAHFCTKS